MQVTRNLTLNLPHNCLFHPKISELENKSGHNFRCYKKINIDPVNSVLIGDKKSDILAG